MASDKSSGLRSLVDELPVDRLKDEVKSGLSSLGQRAVQAAGDRLTGITDKLTDAGDEGGIKGKVAGKAAEEAAGGGSPAMGAIKGGLTGLKDKVTGGGGGGGGKKGTKATNIIEEIDVGVPVDVAYNQWTQFQEFSGFMKKVESVNQEDDTKVKFKAQIFWSHRTWTGKILEQVPNEKIVWRSEGEKGHVDGAVTFHEIGPNLTRILVVLEYYPQGLFERTGNLWRAQGRRARLELKHFRRHVMTEVIQHPDDVEGWRGEIHEGKVVKDHDEAMSEEEESEDQDAIDEDTEGDDSAEDEYDEAEDDEAEDDEVDEDEVDEDEADEDEVDDEDVDDEDAEDEDVEDEADEDEVDEDEDAER